MRFRSPSARRAAALAVLVIAATLPAGCHATRTDPRTVTADEDDQLNGAANALDAPANALSQEPTP